MATANGLVTSNPSLPTARDAVVRLVIIADAFVRFVRINPVHVAVELEGSKCDV
jgi:hypothetical protein